MKYKLTRRMIAQYAAILLLFAAVVGTLFTGVFAANSYLVYEEHEHAHAMSVSETITDFMKRSSDGSCSGNGFRAYFRSIGQLTMSDVWLIDSDMNPVHMELMEETLEESVPQEYVPFVCRVFDTQQVSTLSTTIFATMDNFIVGAPVYGVQGEMQYVLLLRSSFGLIERSYVAGVHILAMCLATALLLSVVLTIRSTRKFISPINKMTEATLRMMDGEYTAQTGVTQQDELGLLAAHIDSLSQRLDEAEAERAKANAHREEFFSNISHELRTPLAALRGSLEVVSEGMITDPDEAQAYMQQMLSDVTHMQRLVNDLLELAKLSDSKFEIDMAPVDLTGILQETMRMMRPVAAQKGVELTIRPSDELAPYCVFGDYGRLRQLFTILLDNAVKFTPSGSDVALCITQMPGECVVKVCDHGVGIAADDLPHIFDRFHHRKTSDNQKGSGLGLPIAREIAQRHDIFIGVESEEGKGTTVILIIPADCRTPV